MLRDSVSAANPQLELAVQQLLIEDVRFDQTERRSAYREHLVRPASIILRETGEIIAGFTRNISYLGIGVVTEMPVHSKSIAKIKVHRLEGKPILFVAECRWARPFGNGWQMSGWHFINVGNE